MKKITILVLTALMMVGCETKTDAEIEEAKRLNGFNIVVIDSCEYLKKTDARSHQGYGYFAHKGNCKYCKERRQKEVEELIKRLKKK